MRPQSKNLDTFWSWWMEIASSEHPALSLAAYSPRDGSHIVLLAKHDAAGQDCSVVVLHAGLPKGQPALLVDRFDGTEAEVFEAAEGALGAKLVRLPEGWRVLG